ncbi:unnamed protein product, partial [Sphagnum troendelagicum]
MNGRASKKKEFGSYSLLFEEALSLPLLSTKPNCTEEETGGPQQLPWLATRNTYTYCNATTAATTTSACQQQTRQDTFRPSGEKAAAAAVVILPEITVAKSLNVAVTTTTTTTTTRGSSCCKASTTQNDLPSRRQIALATLLAGVSF